MPPQRPESPALAGSLRGLDDAEVVRRIADRRQDALGELFDRFSPLLLGLARRILRDSADAEEIVQEVFLQVWGQAHRYDRKRSSVSTWLVLLTRSRAIDLLRSRNVRRRTAVAAEQEEGPRHASSDGPSSVLFEERQRRVQAALAELPGEQREVLALAFYEGLTQREIAERTGTPLGTVKTRTLLAMKKLRTALGAEVRELL